MDAATQKMMIKWSSFSLLLVIVTMIATN